MLPTDAAHFPTATFPSATGPSYFFEQGSAVQFNDAAELPATVTLTSMKVYRLDRSFVESFGPESVLTALRHVVIRLDTSM